MLIDLKQFFNNKKKFELILLVFKFECRTLINHKSILAMATVLTLNSLKLVW